MKPVATNSLTLTAFVLVAWGCEGHGTMGLREDHSAFVQADASAQDVGDSGTAERDATVAPSLAFVSPESGAHLVRDNVYRHQWVAGLDTALTVHGIDEVTLTLDGEELGTLAGAPWSFSTQLSSDGVHELTVTGRNAEGQVLATATTTVTVDAPTDTSCHAMLDALGLDWAPSSSQRGVDDPVYVQPVINGVTFRYTSSTTASRMMMDCELAPRLYEVAELAKDFGFDEIEHIGIYNYRCIGGGDPDTGCTPSMHAHARAIDLHSFNNTSTGDKANVESDWVITEGDVCDEATVPGADTDLHELACAMWQTNTFNIILTPDYNEDHRNHFHVDLTSGRNSISVSVGGIDPLLPNLGD